MRCAVVIVYVKLENNSRRGLPSGLYTVTMSSREGLSSFDPESDRETSTEATNLLDASRSQVYYDSDGETKVNFSTRPNIAVCLYTWLRNKW